MKPIEKIMKQTRNWAMRNRHKYEIPSDLSTMCAIASAKLYKNLKENNYNPIISISQFHCWIELKGNALDITATQFNEAPILILPKKEYYKLLREKDYLGNSGIFHYTNYKMFLKHLLLWPKSQRPNF